MLRRYDEIIGLKANKQGLHTAIQELDTKFNSDMDTTRSALESLISDLRGSINKL
jgi:tellurite resistance protein